jgi:3-methyladenine DNA glycosylase/8-oxoguanine DNA glycosylase
VTAIAGFPRSTSVRVEARPNLRQLLGPLRRGVDPTLSLQPSEAWWATRTPDGPASVHVTLQPGEGGVRVAAWGAGADRVVAGAADLVGATDDPSGFAPSHPVLRELHRRHAGLRLTRTRAVFEAFVPAVLEQKVTGAEARRSFRELVQRFGEPAPDAPGRPPWLRLPVAPTVLARLPSWEWHRAGVDAKRARTIGYAARSAARLDDCVELGVAVARDRLLSLPGVGPWTAAEVTQRALGDADAVSIGDFHLAAFVGWNLLGRPVDDDGMLELLEPCRPHRYRAIRLLEIGGTGKPRFGPRMPVREFRGM